jgi:hypothetical protein
MFYFSRTLFREEAQMHRLDPLMEVLLVHFNTEDDLSNRITGFFRVFDADNRYLPAGLPVSFVLLGLFHPVFVLVLAAATC